MRKPLLSALFLALCVLPLSALEGSLFGTWEASGEEDGASFTTRLTFRADGTFELSNVAKTSDGYWRAPQALFEEDDDLTAAEADSLNQWFRDAWPETPLDTSSFLGSGTYSTIGDSLRLEWVALDITYDDRDFSEFMVSWYTRFSLNWMTAVHAAEGGEFPEEERLALEEEATALAREVFTLEELLAALNEPPPGIYELRDDGEVLVLQGLGISPDGLLFREADLRAKPQSKPLAYRRIDVASAVTPATWGSLKSTLAP